ncbi:hypothetical protein PAF15_05910 [Weissella koreensis]|uniref:hypothetical protein n=1 Tax=Weissella koreensis TaxID=165096 RepID=UPI0022BA2A7B|nr:hypothetical protein [Weissella koreensis]MCZ9311476.1 hypothetical protein [Weissella koreensis]
MNKSILGIVILPILLVSMHTTPHITPHVTTHTTNHISSRKSVRSGNSRTNDRSKISQHNNNRRQSIHYRHNQSSFFRNLIFWNLLTHHSRNDKEFIRVKDKTGKWHKVELSKKQLKTIEYKDKLIYSKGHVYEGEKRIN